MTQNIVTLLHQWVQDQIGVGTLNKVRKKRGESFDSPLFYFLIYFERRLFC